MLQPSTDLAELSPYVTVLQSGGNRNLFEQVLQDGACPGQLALAVSHVLPAEGTTVAVAKFERHPHTTQSFLPLSVGRWLIVVAPTLPDGSPDLTNVRSAVGQQGDAICIERDVWHTTLTVLDRAAEVVMVMWRAESGADTVYSDLARPLAIDVGQ
jgi:ureidoglycolate lyase